MKSALIIILSLLFVAIYVNAIIPDFADQVQAHEVLPSPILILPDKSDKNKYFIESHWYGTLYEDDGTSKKKEKNFYIFMLSNRDVYEKKNIFFFVRQSQCHTPMQEWCEG